MTDKLDYQEIMWFEQTPDVYEPKEKSSRWYCYAAGDMDGDFDDKVELPASRFPPGTKVVVMLPACPECGEDVEVCQELGDCDFDWDGWAEDKYG